MTSSGYKYITITLILVVVLLAALCGKLFVDYAALNISTSLARGQIQTFDDMRDRALNSDVTESANCLRYAAHYYQSGTKQTTGSTLDWIVERQRGEAVQAIIAHLRAKSGENLGDDPEKWVEKYAKK